MADGRSSLCHLVLHHCVCRVVFALTHHHPPTSEASAAVRVAAGAHLLHWHSHFLYVYIYYDCLMNLLILIDCIRFQLFLCSWLCASLAAAPIAATG